MYGPERNVHLLRERKVQKEMYVYCVNTRVREEYVECIVWTCIPSECKENTCLVFAHVRLVHCSKQQGILSVAMITNPILPF